MWNTESVKELFEQLNDTWIDRTGEPLKLEYTECMGNFISYIDSGNSGDKSLLYISDMANDLHIPEDIARMKFIYSFFIIKHSYEIGRFMQCRNPSGMIEFLEGIGKHICKKLGYAFYTHDEIFDATNKYSEKYIKRIITEHEKNALIRDVNSDDEYRIEYIDNGDIFLRSVSSDQIINMDELRGNKVSLPSLMVTF